MQARPRRWHSAFVLNEKFFPTLSPLFLVGGLMMLGVPLVNHNQFLGGAAEGGASWWSRLHSLSRIENQQTSLMSKKNTWGDVFHDWFCQCCKTRKLRMVLSGVDEVSMSTMLGTLCPIQETPQADPGFWSGGPSRILTPRGALSPIFFQNRGFSLKIP